MALSMTGFGTASLETEDRLFVVELRSVNHRYCDIRTHLPPELVGLSKPIEAAVRARVQRGRVDVSVQWEQRSGVALRPQVDLARARGYAEAHAEVAEALGLEGTLTVAQVLDAPGVLKSPDRSPGTDDVLEALIPLLNRALDDFLAMRAIEGRALVEEMRQHLGQVLSLAAAVKRDIGPAVAERKAKLEQRVAELLGEAHSLDPSRLAQEIALIADRIDVAEELERLDSHCNQFSGLLSSEGAVGRKLDFLIQEMNREANTIGSKCANATIAHLVVDLKAELERMREQIQNVE